MLERVQDLLEGGTPLVWVLYPELEKIQVFGFNGSVRTLEKGDTLEDERVLPGFRYLVSKFFMKI